MIFNRAFNDIDQISESNFDYDSYQDDNNDLEY